MKYFFKTLIVLVVCALPFFAVGQAQEQEHEHSNDEAPQGHVHTAWCGSTFSDEQLQSLEQFVDYYYYRGGKEAYAAQPRAVKYVPISYHITGNADGSNRYQITKALDDLCQLNEDMQHTDIQFYLKYPVIDLNISNDAWNNGTASTQDNLLFSFFNDLDAVNVYQVQNIYSSQTGTTVLGRASGSVFFNASAPSPGGSGILLRAGAASNDFTFAHEFGHNLSLPHTFFGWEGANDYTCGEKAPAWAERYSGANCTTQGDRLCDTAPDYVTGFQCNGSGTLNTGCIQMDADSATGYADGANVMSYGFNCSPKLFSQDQINAMDWHLTNLRASQITYTPVTLPITSKPTLTSPINGVAVDFYDQATLEWTSVPNATHYAIEINRLPTFPENLMLDMAIVGNTTTYTSVASFTPNTTYYWRVRPYNEGYFCTENSSTGQFKSGDLASSTTTITAVEKMELLPNLAKSGQRVNLVINADATFDASINIFDLNGRMISSEQTVIPSGSTVYPINTNDLTAGMYIVAVQSENGVVNKKLVVAE